MTQDFLLSLAQAITKGLLTGMVYGLMALGLSVIFGVMRVVNFAHGEMMIVGMYLAWMGFDRDEALCARLHEATGIRATTSGLAFRDLFQRKGIKRVGLVTPYLEDVQQKIMTNWAAAGFACSAERHLSLQDNFSFGVVPPEEIADMTRAVIQEGCDAAAIVCTNLRGAEVAAALEAELGVPVYDSVAVTLAECLRLAGRDPRVVSGWGSVFSDQA